MPGTLRLPVPLDPTSSAYKDWLHLNIFDPASGAVGLVNVSLHGSPEDPRSRAVGTALVYRPGVGWRGNVEATGVLDARLLPGGIALERVAMVLDDGNVVHVAANFEEDGLVLRAKAFPVSRTIAIEERLPFGSGWMSWRVVPRLRLEGEWFLDGHAARLDDSPAYHDHNWGRWYWGDDAGWEWAACLGENVTLVVTRATDRLRRRLGRALLFADVAGARRTFAGPVVHLRADGALDAVPRRLPGALAAARVDRARPRLPERLTVEADDGVDRCVIRIRPRGASQLIAADPIRPGYGFIHQLPGSFEAEGRIGGRRFEATGLAILEHVD